MEDKCDFFLGNLTFKQISTFKCFTYITVRMTANIATSIFINIFLERISLSQIVFVFPKATVGGDGRAL